MNRRNGSLAIILLGILLCAHPVSAVPLINDPKGFHDIVWGAALTVRQDMEATRSGPHITEYRLKTEAPSFAGAEMTSILYVSVDGISSIIGEDRRVRSI